jgi:threonine dehydrogenase-like Zn-dependent dehydrogenase
MSASAAVEVVGPSADAAGGGIDRLPVDTGGGFSPLMVAHARQLFRIPDAVPNERAVLLEPTAVAVHAVLRRLPQPGDHVLVIGGGTIGLLVMAVLRAYAPEIELHCVVRHDVQAALAEWLGALVHRPGASLARDLARATGACYVRAVLNNEAMVGGFDVIFDAVGSGATLRDALRWVRASGSVLLVGAELRSGRFDYTPLWHQEIDLLGVFGHGTEADGRTSFDHAAELLADPTFPVEGLVTHRFPMDAWQDAVHAFLDKRRSGAVKIVLEHLVG